MSLPSRLETVSDTLYVPGSLNMCDGFCSDEVVPSKSQVQVCGKLVLLSVKVTVRGAQPDSTLGVNAATGGVFSELTSTAPFTYHYSIVTIGKASNLCCGFVVVPEDCVRCNSARYFNRSSTVSNAVT